MGMALPLSALSPSATSFFRIPAIFLNSVRCKSRGSPAQSQKRKRRFFPWGLTVHAGCEVQEKDIIAFQKMHTLKYHPGLNTGIDPRNNSLYATRDGKVVVTTEKFNPNKEHEMVQKFYADVVGTMYKRYVHVIPPKDEVAFKLIDIV